MLRGLKILKLPGNVIPLHSNRSILAPRALIASVLTSTNATTRPFNSSCSLRQITFPSRPKPPPEEEIEEFFLKGSGPGGQKINKTNSAVQLRHKPTGIVVKCQETRSRDQNRKIARQNLADKLDDIANGDKSRSAVVGQIKAKRKSSSSKKSRRKYRKLEEEKAAAAASFASGFETAVDSQEATRCEVKETTSQPKP